MRIVITGGSFGLGRAIVERFVYNAKHNIFFPNQNISIFSLDTKENALEKSFFVNPIICDVTNKHAVLSIVEEIEDIDILINNAGVNYINWLEHTPEYEWNKVLNVNAKSIFLCSKYFAPGLKRNKGTILNITSNAAHIPMTNSICYNASKGAAHIMTLQLARELGPQGITVFGIAPNKLKGTEMSKYIEGKVCNLRYWTPQEAKKYQLKSLPAGEETDPAALAEFISFILSTKQRHKYMAGTIIPYGT